ncbi:MAG TPA: tetratricopeptide repeat protein [Terriglobales bacterium]|nr:tetratricopeptide repeat protein [Terriglobales bacterium]
MFLYGRVASEDGSPIPNDAMIERVCNGSVRQQVYTTSRGDFSMQLGSMADSFLDASGDPPSRDAPASSDSRTGIPRRKLANCELRASISGFQSRVISLMGLTEPGNESIDVGAIVVKRRTKNEGMTISAIPYKAPANARKAYEQGLGNERNGNLIKARKNYEKAVEIFPSYASAWFQLGTVLQKENQENAARAAFTQATTVDTKFLPPYLSLALMALEARNWKEVLTLTDHILDPDPFNHIAGYIVDLDPLDYTAAYFYNSVANYKLNNIEPAEKSARNAERLDLRTRFPQLHLLLAEIYARKNNYGSAISEIQTYLQLVPQSKDRDQVREWQAKLEKLNDPVPTSGKPDQN